MVKSQIKVETTKKKSKWWDKRILNYDISNDEINRSKLWYKCGMVIRLKKVKIMTKFRLTLYKKMSNLGTQKISKT